MLLKQTLKPVVTQPATCHLDRLAALTHAFTHVEVAHMQLYVKF